MKKLFSFNNIYFALLSRILIIVILFTLTRIIFYIFNSNYFSTSPQEFFFILLFGLKFDISAIVVVNILYIFFQTIPFNFRGNKAYQKTLEIIFYITNGIAIFLNCVDVVYFRYVFRRTTFDIIKSIFIGEDFRTMFWKYVADYWYILIIWIVMILLMVFLYKKTKRNYAIHNRSVTQHLLAFLWFVIAIGLSVVFFRGGFQLRPISLVTAGEYTTADNVPLVINTPFSIYSTSKKQALKEKNYFDEYKAEKIYNPLKNVRHKNGLPLRKLNVVIIIVESLSKEYIGALNQDMEEKKYTGYTPFLDSLITHSLCFEQMFANSKRSIEGIPAILSGLPSLMDDSYLTSSFSGNRINSLPLLLKKYGYKSVFFHGGKNGTLNFDAYAKMAGFESYVGKNEYNNDADYDGKWGIYDEEFLQYAVKILNQTPEPFIASIYTLSSHHPYSIPKKYKNKFKKGSLEIHESIMYTDYSLKQFFNACSKMSWFDSTLFVITADHASLAGSAYYHNNAGSFAIPLIFYMHHSSLAGRNQVICQQADILPSVLDFLNYNEPFISFGNSVFDTTADHFSINYYNGSYQLLKDSFLLEFDGDKSHALYNFIEDKLLQNDLVYTQPKKRAALENFIKAYIQSYNHRMIKNKLTDTNE